MSSTRRSSGRRGLRASATAALIAIAAFVIGGVALSGVGSAGNGSTPSSAPSATPTMTPTPTSTSALTTRSAPIALTISAIGVHAKPVQLGSDKDKKMVLPPPRAAGWFTGSVSPGQNGVSVIAGFIRGSSHLPGVFAKMAKLTNGDRISIQRADHATAVYSVTAIKNYPSGQFPASQVYAATAQPELRIITTGGALRPNSPSGNVVVYAHLVDVQ